MRKNIVAGNWKMNKTLQEGIALAKYAFNKSHAACYAFVAFRTAYLKYYYPVEFMAALMTSVIDNSAKAAEYLLHCKELGISVLPPDINVGQGEFTAEGNAVRYGLYAIKSLGRPVIDSIIGERKKGGSYRTLQDFIERTVQRDINKRAIENLINRMLRNGHGLLSFSCWNLRSKSLKK